MEKYMYADLPPITTETLPTEIQRQIKDQSWAEVSVRQPIGCLENDPSAESLISYISNILEGRLADVVIHRRELKLAYSRRLTMEDDALSPTKSVEKFIEELRSPQGLQCSHCSSDLCKCNERNNSSAQGTVLLTSACRYQLRAYVRRIASMYRNNRYHGLEHATHVTMSANKLLDMLNEGESRDGLDDSTKSDDTNNSNGCTSNGSTANADWSLQDDLIKSSTRNHKKIECKNSFGDTKSWSNFVSMAADVKSGTSSGDLNHRNMLKRSKLLRSFRQHVYSDMFSKFAFVFSAVIHDVDHQGVPNTRLVLEGDPIVEQHGNSSTAEKHSIKVAFRTLNESEFDILRSVIFESSDDHFQLQRIVTSVVVSTDIASPERAQSTRMRWDEAFFHPSPCSSLPFGKLSMVVKFDMSEIATVQASKPLLVSTQDLSTNLQRKQPRRHSSNTQEMEKKLSQSESDRDSIYYDFNDQDTRIALQQSVLIETMLNVADVAHAMQSWELFLFWNRRLYEELYVAYKIGRSEIDPSVDWFQNQLGFYKLYIIPLAKKMQTCGVFGRLGCVWTNNAIAIRDRWSREGDQITTDMIASVKTAFMSVTQIDVPQSHRGPGAA
jgi:hypothetical protein